MVIMKIFLNKTKLLFIIFVLILFGILINVEIILSAEDNLNSLSDSESYNSLSDINEFWPETENKTPKWGRDPFVKFSEKEKSIAIPPPPPKLDLSKFAISAILYRKSGAVAIINNQIVREKEFIGDVQVFKIDEKKVILRDRYNRKYQLSIGKPYSLN